MAKPFDLVDSVSSTKVNLMREDPETEKDYEPFLTNRALSYHADSILYANEMNCCPELHKLMQYEYLLHSLRPRSRRSKWHKKAAEDVELEKMVAETMGLSMRKAREIIPLLTAGQRDEIMSSRGGTEMSR